MFVVFVAVFVVYYTYNQVYFQYTVMNNDQFNIGISATTHPTPWDVLPDLGNTTGCRGGSTWLDTSVRRHFDKSLQKNSHSHF